MNPVPAPHFASAVATLSATLFLAACATTPATHTAKTDPAVVAAAAATAAVQAAQTPPPAGAPGTGRPASTTNVAAAAAAAAAAAGQPKPFAEVIKDAKETKGLFTLYAKDEKVWIEIVPEQFDKSYHFQLAQERGVGQRLVFGGMMGPSQVARFKKIGNNVQLIAKNHQFYAKEGTPMARAVQEGFSDSLIGSAAVVSQPHPDRKSILIEANALLLTDFAPASYFGWGVAQRGYTFDARNSSFENIYATPDQISMLVLAHYTSPRAPLPPPPSPSPTPNPYPPFTALPDARSLFLGLRFSIAKLPEPMMAARPADPRVGHFTDVVYDFSDDYKYTPRKHLVNRWRLEKKDPNAAVSEPVAPVTYWIDRNVPEKYRDAVRAGILEWNKAFEKAGFKDALRVEVQPDNADWSTADARHATVRWFVGAEMPFAIGPSMSDPRTGEIIDADVAIPDIWARGDRRMLREEIGNIWPAFEAYKEQLGLNGRRCSFALEAYHEAMFGLDLLVERGEIAPDSPEAEAYVQASIKEVVMHEVGHTLGLAHNFRASTIYPLEKLSDREFTKVNGLTGSVMDYTPVNLALKGELQGEYHNSTLGPYDYWAIEYAYKPIAPEAEKEELARIAARGSTDPTLAFSSDQEAVAALDPAASHWDFGNDPLSYVDRRFKLTAELWQRLQDKVLAPGQPYDQLRRTFDAGMLRTGLAAQVTAKYIGGVSYVRDFAGSARNPLTPVDPDKQRAALKLLATNVFSAESFRFKPGFMQRMGVDYLMADGSNPNPDFSLANRVLALQSGALSQLMGDTVARRLLDSESKVAPPQQAFRVSELYTTLRVTIWSELKSGADIPLIRRNLQRDHAARLASALLRPAASLPADARALMRIDAKALSGQIAATKSNPRLSAEAKAHLAEMQIMLDEALKAPLVRQAV